MERAETDEPLAHSVESLSNAHNEQVIGLLGIELREGSEQAGDSGVVGARGYEPQAEDGALSQLRVLVVAQTGQLVDDAVLWVGHVEQSQRQRDHSLHGQLAVMQQMLEGPQRHLSADLLSH